MKKILAFLLVLTLCSTFAGCGGKDSPGGSSSDSTQVSTSGGTSSGATSETNKEAKQAMGKARTISTNKAAKRNLDNTFYKLKNQKSLKIGYLGASITNGFGSGTGGCWRVKTTQWFKDKFPSANIEEINLAVGGTSSNTGLFRLCNELLAQKPDTVFVEFAINDAYMGFSKTDAAAYIDAIIRTINTNLPQTDIIMVLTTDSGNVGKIYETAAGHLAVAEYYGIPCIDVGAALGSEMSATGNPITYYLVDSTHPNDTGYAIYAKKIIEGLQKELSAYKGNGIVKHNLPSEAAVTNPYKNIKIIPVDQIKDKGNWSSKIAKDSVLKYKTAIYPKKKGDKITIEIEGSAITLLGNFKAEGVEVEATVDGGNAVKPKVSQFEIALYTNLKPGKHTVTITNTGKGYVEVGYIVVA